MAESYDYEVVEEVKEDFCCVICLNLMKDAMQLECGHGMCKLCLDDLEKNSRERYVRKFGLTKLLNENRTLKARFHLPAFSTTAQKSHRIILLRVKTCHCTQEVAKSS